MNPNETKLFYPTNLMKNFTWATVNTINDKCVSGAGKFFRIKKCESLAFQEQVNHSCLGEVECLHPFEPNSDQKLKKKKFIDYSFGRNF